MGSSDARQDRRGCRCRSAEAPAAAHRLRQMNKGRLEAFSDGVFAIIITIMVLDLRVPSGPSLEALRSTVPVFLSYVLSFVYVGIYWNNHHHLLHASERVSGPILWANLHLLFWLSLAPFATRWVGENYNAPWPIALYGLMLLFAGVAYFILTKSLIAHHGAASRLATSIGKDRKGLASVIIYVIAILSPSFGRRPHTAFTYLSPSCGSCPIDASKTPQSNALASGTAACVCGWADISSQESNQCFHRLLRPLFHEPMPRIFQVDRGDIGRHELHLRD